MGLEFMVLSVGFQVMVLLARGDRPDSAASLICGILDCASGLLRRFPDLLSCLLCVLLGVLCRICHTSRVAACIRVWGLGGAGRV